MPFPRPPYILRLNIILNLFRFHDAGSVTSKGNQENHEVLFQEIFEKRKNGGAAEYFTLIRNAIRIFSFSLINC